jgi:hypothetical protein
LSVVSENENGAASVISANDNSLPTGGCNICFLTSKELNPFNLKLRADHDCGIMGCFKSWSKYCKHYKKYSLYSLQHSKHPIIPRSQSALDFKLKGFFF